MSGRKANFGRKKTTVFDVVNVLIMLLLIAGFIFPFWLLVTASFSENVLLEKNGFSVAFQGFTFEAYKFVFDASDVFFHSIFITILTSCTTVALSLIACVSAGYVLSRKYLKGLKFLNVLVMIPMFFSGGMIPTYLVIRGIGIYNTIWALILPAVTSTYNILLIRNYFYGLGNSLEEAAHIDGANDLQILVRIFVPLSVPVMITVGFMTFVGRWNSWLASLLYLSAGNKNLWTLQYVLRQILTDQKAIFGNIDGAPLRSAQNAGIMISVLPLLIIAPVIQKFFVRGITAGAVKG